MKHAATVMIALARWGSKAEAPGFSKADAILIFILAKIINSTFQSFKSFSNYSSSGTHLNINSSCLMFAPIGRSTL